MIWLHFLNVNFIVAHNEQGLRKLDVMNEADELILAIAEYAAKVDDAEDGEAPFEEECEDGHLHQIFADLDMVRLNVL